MGRFNKQQQNAEVQKAWREANLVPLTEEQLKSMDTELENFGKLGTRAMVFKYLVHKGAATWIANVQIAVRPNRYEMIMDRIEQWSRWRERKFPFDQRLAYERVAAEKAAMGEGVSV